MRPAATNSSSPGREALILVPRGLSSRTHLRHLCRRGVTGEADRNEDQVRQSGEMWVIARSAVRRSGAERAVDTVSLELT